jgi:hypothetical protein
MFDLLIPHETVRDRQDTNLQTAKSKQARINLLTDHTCRVGSEKFIDYLSP